MSTEKPARWKRTSRNQEEYRNNYENTKDGLLAGKLREEENRLATLTNFRVKIVETGGDQLQGVF